MRELETTGYYALGIPLYALVMSVESWVGRRRGERYFCFPETLSNLTAGLGTLVLGLFTGPYVFFLYHYAYTHWALVRWDLHSPWAVLRWPLALLLSDLCYYAHHRAGHRFAFLWAIHGVHHQHEQLNSTVGLRLEWLADLSTLFFFAPMPLLGVDPETGFLVIAFLSLYALTTHAPALARRSWGVFVTPATHGAHHSRDARFLHCNYSSMFALWDQLFGTWIDPPEHTRLQSDVPSVCRTHDGVSTQWSLLRELCSSIYTAPSHHARWHRLIDAPTLTTPTPSQLPREESSFTATERNVFTLDFLGISILATALLWSKSTLVFSLAAMLAVLVLSSLYTLGGLLDARPNARRWQQGRLLAQSLLAFVCLLQSAWIGLLVALGILMALPSVTRASLKRTHS